MWTFGSCGGVRMHPMHPPGYGPEYDNVFENMCKYLHTVVKV